MKKQSKTYDNIFKVVYLPKISEEAREYIQDNFTPSVGGHCADNSAQYNLEIIINDLVHKSKFAKDYFLLFDLLNQDVDYIEIFINN